ncbi:MAG: hypothetical protein V2I48_14430 [Xanthomonadales bacterium]|nr:hypothetical protein [Xanthomonadales bacterium]
MRFSLRNFSLEAVTHLGNTKIREISAFGEDRLLFAETASISRKKVARISWFDLKTGRAQALYSGVQARYIARADTMVYDDGNRLYAITQANGTETTSEVLSHKRHQLSAMLEVSNGRLLLEIVEDGQALIQSYHAEDDTLTRLDRLASVCRLKGAVWMEDLQQLACTERSGGNAKREDGYIFADLDGQTLSRPSLPPGEKLLALTYVRDQGLLILNQTGRNPIDGRERSAVWVHDVRSGENHEISDTLDLGSSVVYSVR